MRSPDKIVAELKANQDERVKKQERIQSEHSKKESKLRKELAVAMSMKQKAGRNEMPTEGEGVDHAVQTKLP